MIDKTDLILYVVGLTAVLLVGFFVYRFFRKNKAGGPNSEVMNKISDFYSKQDRGHNY
ncbi:MAG: hypothetical protein HZB10_02145 [Candidatus Yonathbacteria bacterium]|nr:hypothetical protein [Candidatus Yonathbacteria bacterium]